MVLSATAKPSAIKSFQKQFNDTFDPTMLIDNEVGTSVNTPPQPGHREKNKNAGNHSA